MTEDYGGFDEGAVAQIIEAGLARGDDVPSIAASIVALASNPAWRFASRHPVRPRILEFLREVGAAAPKDASERLGISLGTVAYHFKMLASLGLIEPAGTQPRRGAVAHYYRLAGRHHLPPEPPPPPPAPASTSKPRRSNTRKAARPPRVSDPSRTSAREQAVLASDYISVAAAAQLAEVTTQTIHNWMRLNEIDYLRVDGGLRVRQPDVERRAARKRARTRRAD